MTRLLTLTWIGLTIAANAATNLNADAAGKVPVALSVDRTKDESITAQFCVDGKPIEIKGGNCVVALWYRPDGGDEKILHSVTGKVDDAKAGIISIPWKAKDCKIEKAYACDLVVMDPTQILNKASGVLTVKDKAK